MPYYKSYRKKLIVDKAKVILDYTQLLTKFNKALFFKMFYRSLISDIIIDQYKIKFVTCYTSIDD